MNKSNIIKSIVIAVFVLCVHKTQVRDRIFSSNNSNNCVTEKKSQATAPVSKKKSQSDGQYTVQKKSKKSKKNQTQNASVADNHAQKLLGKDKDIVGNCATQSVVVPKKKTLPDGRYTVQNNYKKSKKEQKVYVRDRLFVNNSSNNCVPDNDLSDNRETQKEKRKRAREEYRVVHAQKVKEYQEYKSFFDDVNISNYGSFSYGFTKYIVPSKYWYTTATSIEGSLNNSRDALMSTNKTLMMPLIRAALGIQFDNVPCWFNQDRKRTIRFGVEVSYAKRNNAYKATYTDLLSTTTGSLTAYQDVNRATVMFVSSFDVIRTKSQAYSANLDLGVGFVTGALKNLKLYDFGTYLFRGEYLPANKLAAAGFVGISLVRYFDQNDINLELSYRVVMNRAQYKNLVERTLGVPGSLTYATQAPLSVPQYVGYRLGYGDSLFVYSNEVALAMSKAF